MKPFPVPFRPLQIPLDLGSNPAAAVGSQQLLSWAVADVSFLIEQKLNVLRANSHLKGKMELLACSSMKLWDVVLMSASENCILIENT
jgi:hypothetical protein